MTIRSDWGAYRGLALCLLVSNHGSWDVAYRAAGSEDNDAKFTMLPQRWILLTFT